MCLNVSASQSIVDAPKLIGSTENAGLEFAGVENAGQENARQKPEDPEMYYKQVS